MTIIKFMNKSCALFGLLAVLLIALAASSCDVGLGESIDTSAPTVTITYPSSSSSVSGSLIIRGVCHDDKSLDKVVVTVTNTKDPDAEPITKESKISGNDWSVVLDGMDFPDGTYSADVVVYDGAGRTSVTANRVFDVDNTPPVFCLTKPNSIDISDPAAYGRDVVVRGEIADDHAVQQMDIAVYKYDASTGTASEIVLPHKTFTGFETAGGTEVKIAKYFSEAPADTSSDDYKLYMNYKAMYTDQGASPGDTVTYYIFPSLKDAAGNVSKCAYIQSQLKQLVHSACGLATTADSLQTAQLKKILNGSYSLAELNEENLAKMKEILKGEYDQSAGVTSYKYYADSENTLLAMSLNANNSPMYEFGGYVYDKNDPVFKEVASGGQMSVKVTAGLDGNKVVENSIRVYLWECDDTLKLADGLDLTKKSTASFSSDTDDEDKKITVLDKDNKDITTLAETEEVPTGTYSFTLPASLSAGVHYILTADGYDVEANHLFSTATYAFMVAATGDAPKIEWDDQFFINSDAINSKKSADYKAKILIKDKSGDSSGTINQSGNWVKITPTLYKGYAKTKAYLESDAVLLKGDEQKFTESNIVKESDGSYYIEVPMNLFDLSALTAAQKDDNYTVALQVQAKNTGATSESLTYIFWADSAAPSLSVTAPARAADAAESSPIYIFESDKNITVSSGSYSYTARGTWSDISGSGSSEIFYTTGAPGALDKLSLVWTEATGNAQSGKVYYQKQAEGCYLAQSVATGASLDGQGFYTLSLSSTDEAATETVWTAIEGAPQSTSKANWNVSYGVENSSAQKISFVAVDKTGNKSGIVTKDNITFDFEPPVITLPDVKEYYVLSDATDSKYTFTIGISDASGIMSLDITAKKDGSEVASGASGYTLAKASDKTAATITLKNDGTSEGLWSFDIAAADNAEREAAASVSWTIDTVNPERVFKDASKEYYVTIGESSPITDWQNSENLTISGKFVEATSGLDYIEYTVVPAGGSALETQQEVGFNLGADNKYNYKISPVGFVEGTNTVTIKAVDKAGNASSSEPYSILVDTSTPLATTAYYTYDNENFSEAAGTVMASGNSDMIVYGTLEETLSGIKSVAFKINNIDVSGDVKYTKTSLSGTSSASDYKGAEWAAYSAADNTKYTGYKITIPKAKLASIESGDVELYIEATDQAGNKLSQKKFVISLDNTAPEITIKQPDAESRVNGALVFSGIVDDKALSLVQAYWSENGDDTVINTSRKPNPDIEIVDENGDALLIGTYSWNVPMTVSWVDQAAKKITMLGDAVAYSGTAKTIYLKILAQDKAANSAVKIQKYIIDPETDRPKITLTSAALSGMSATKPALYDSSKIEGTIEDDDGVTKLEYSIDAGTNWTEVAVSGGSWTIDMGDNSDGVYTILFRVTDAAGTVFESVKSSGSDIYLSPVIAGKDTSFSTGDTSLYLKIDTASPEYSDLVYKTSSASGGTYELVGEDGSKLGTVGGKKKYIGLEFNAKDANGITAVSAAIKKDSTIYGQSVAGTVGSKTAAGVYPCTITGIDVSELESGVYTLELTIIGSFEQDKTTDLLPITVDNTAPNVRKLAPDENAVNGSVSVYGTVDYAKEMSYAISQSAETSPDDDEFKQITGASMTWFVYFDGDTDNSNGVHDITLNQYIIKMGVSAKCSDGVTRPATAASINDQTFDAIVPLYIWISAEDDVGNIYKKAHLINLDPQGGRPTFTYGYPESDASRIGGSVKIYGGADDDEAVRAVFLQIISTSHELDGYTTDGKNFGSGSYDEASGKITFNLTVNDLDYLKAAGYKVLKMADYPTETEWSGSGTPSEYGVLADFKGVAWSIRINSNNEFNPSGDNTNALYLRGYAYDGSKFSLPQDRYVIVDADSPQMSNRYLRQYSGTSVTASKEYSDGVYVKGEWNLEFDMTDSDEIAKVYIGKSDASAAAALADATSKQAADTADKDVSVIDSVCSEIDDDTRHGYHAKIGLESGTGVGSRFYYVIFADKKGNKSDYAFTVYYDNTPPVISSTSIDTAVHNSNGWYELGASVTETTQGSKNQSGFDKFAFYFVRETKLYDPMISKRKNGADNPDNWASIDGMTLADDGLYWFTLPVEARDETNLNIIKLQSANAHVHEGRLVKIGGSVYTILSVADDGLTVTLDGQPEASYTTAEFCYANIIDNTKQENAAAETSSTEGYGYGYYSALTNDDGDLMQEWANVQGTTTSLKAQINSKNIPDGNIEIHYVAFDKAGNVTTGSVMDAYVSNNAPRLANITVASDYNYDGTYSDAESRSYYKTSIADWEDAETSMTLGEEAHPFIAAKGAVIVMPEILGGNGALTWTWTYPTASGTGNGTGGMLSADTPEEENAARTLNEMKLAEATLAAAKTGAGEYSITISDSTESGAQKAVINLWMKNDVNDSETPVGKTKRFFWKGLTNNSVYGSSSAQSHSDLKGHIELPETWTDEDGTEHSFANPKVSGKIVIKGTAFDNAGIKQINITLPGFVNTATKATACDLSNADTAARWTQTELGTLGTDGYHFAIDAAGERYTNTGHFVPWTLEIDTEQYSGGAAPAKEGVNFVLAIVDKNGKTSGTANAAATVYASSKQAAAGKYYAEERFAAADSSSGYANADYSADEFSAIGGAEESDTDGIYKYAVTPVAADYTMDIVPYITKVTTSLSAVNETNGVTDRSSLGHYPVYVYKNSTAAAARVDQKAADKTEPVNVYGFNLAGAKYGTNDLSGSYMKESAGSYVSLSSGLITSGNFALTVGGVSTQNNLNNNNAKGSYSSTATVGAGGNYSVYKNYSNRQPNNENNNNLTDDVVFDVWELNNMAAAPMSGSVDDPQMKINPNGKIGFAFSNGSSAFTMPNSTYSWTYWAYDYDRVRYIALNYDPAGYAWAAAAGQDTHNDGGDPFFMETTRYRNMGGGNSHGYADVTDSSAWKLERISVDKKIMQDRIQSPSFANTTGGVYLAYYDSYKGEIRYRAGKISNMGKNNGNTTNAAFDFFTNDGNAANVDYSRDNVQIVAASSSSGYTTPGKAGPYVSIAAVDGGATVANDVVVMVWQDQEAGHLWYSYLGGSGVDPTDTSRKNNATAAGWATPVDPFDGKNVTGEYCQIAVDKRGGVHIAAYDSNEADVWYAYKAAYGDAWTVAKVDTYDSTGVYLTLDAALDSDGNPAPQIGFYSMASARPKYAKWNSGAGSLAALSSIDGTDSSDSYTGLWEVSNIPTASAVRKSNTSSKVKQNINVAVWKDSEGKVTGSTTGNSFCIGSATGGTSGTNANNKGDVYGNGTDNAVLGYMYGSDSAAYIETAQRK